MANNKKTSTADINELCQDVILQQIASLRSDYNAIEHHAPNETIPFNKESFCHAFYRMIGFPVVGIDGERFYNPGFLGIDSTQEERTYRSQIDKSQDLLLVRLENTREILCQNNSWTFDSADTKLDYMLDMMTSPIKTNLMTDGLDPLQNDQKQSYIDPDRQGLQSKTVTKILRPFKCSASLVNYVTPTAKALAAPFIIDKAAVVLGKPLNRTYLEFIARMRFSLDISRIDSAYNDTAAAIFGSIKELAELQKNDDAAVKVVNEYSHIEISIIEKMLENIKAISLSMRDEILKAKTLSDKIRSESNLFFGNSEDEINSAIAEIQSQKDAMDMIYSQLPGQEKSNNKILCGLGSTFIKLNKPNYSDLEERLKNLQQTKKKRADDINSINKLLFYTLGEVTGIGLLDIMAVMFSLSFIPQEYLLGLFDDYSFRRMCRDPKMKNDVVMKRIENNYKSTISFKECLRLLDSTIFKTLKMAEDIIKSNSNTGS